MDRGSTSHLVGPVGSANAYAPSPVHCIDVVNPLVELQLQQGVAAVFNSNQPTAPVVRGIVPDRFVNHVRVNFRDLDAALKFYESDGIDFHFAIPKLEKR